MEFKSSARPSLIAAQRLLPRGSLSLGALLLGATCVMFAAVPGAHAGDHGWARGRILVKMKQGATQTKFDQVLKKHLAKRSGKRLHAGGADVVNLPLGIDEATAADLLSRDPAVEYAEVDRLLEPDAISTNDTYFPNAWHLPKIGATDAWSYTTGAGVTIAILDSGVDGSHPDLAPLMVAGWNFHDNNSNTTDVYGHGTKVAGAAAASSNNGVGVASVSWQSKIMPLRVSLPDGTAYLSTVATAISWAADRGARVANVSFQSAAGSASIQNAAQYMKSKGGMVVVSAGNTGAAQSFSASDTLIAVSATDSGDNKAGWSSYGAYVDFAAPGVSIYTTTNGGGYAAVHGTSFASPVTAGVIALMMSRNASLTPAQIESILKSTAVDLGSAGRDDLYGSGRINAAAAVAAAGGGSVSPPPSTGGGSTTTKATLTISVPSGTTSNSAGLSSLAAGTTITANWGGISSPTATDWIALHAAGSTSGHFEWMYVSCSQVAGAAKASGSCAFKLPVSLSAGNYELALYAAGSSTQLARSNTFAVTAATSGGTGGSTGGTTGATISANTTNTSAGGTITVSWSGISAPAANDWFGLYSVGAAATSYIDWSYVGCSKSPTSARASGSCSVVLPSNLPSGTYELRLFNIGWTQLSKTATFSVGSGGGTVTGVPTVSTSASVVSRGGSLTVNWSGLSSSTTTDWLGLMPAGAASTSYVSWIYVSCSQTASAARASGSCTLPVPAGIAAGNYEVRLLPNNGFTSVATTPVSVQ